jgi:hypothetical protein
MTQIRHRPSDQGTASWTPKSREQSWLRLRRFSSPNDVHLLVQQADESFLVFIWLSFGCPIRVCLTEMETGVESTRQELAEQ